ncbi:MAG: laccase domain-containing protein, partial [Bacteroidetes bacterium]|nr:laccase domain-containing protein [Bacteroidota bacterium]
MPRYLTPAIFDGMPQVVAGFSTRRGGTSAPPYDSLNLSLSPDDEADAMRANRRRLFEQVGFSVDDLALAGQVHGARVEHVTAPGLYRGVDGLVTATPGVLLCITAADCAAVLLADAGADAEAGVVGACHAGWRGTVARIVPTTVAQMQ